MQTRSLLIISMLHVIVQASFSSDYRSLATPNSLERHECTGNFVANNLKPIIRCPEEIRHLLRRLLGMSKQRERLETNHIAVLQKRARHHRGSLGPDVHHQIQDEDTSPRPESRHERLDDLDDVLVGPVVKDPLEEVDVGLNGLRGEEVMSEEGHSLLELVGDVAVVKFRLATRQILDDDLEIGEFFGKR